jgi:hypothetical protein
MPDVGFNAPAEVKQVAGCDAARAELAKLLQARPTPTIAVQYDRGATTSKLAPIRWSAM